ncbi:MAG: tyrosine--tRNA ligase [Clostridiales bacterium]|jgi:tyrosyl-tRNA synthetase|nr:tyrosine--tRNA ligase [Clostridiales bacterium]
MNVFEELQARGLVAQMTDPERIEEMLTKEKIKFYIGFDPTADSLHVGHFVQVMVMAHMQRAGHTPIALFGGGTGMVGDPSGKSDMRKMLTKEIINHNIDCFRKQMSALVDFSEGKAIMVNNGDWLLKLNYIEFLREIGIYFSVNRMLAAECYKQRMEKGLTFFELNYMIMQSYDFLVLNRKYGCVLQLGGDDQWSNILGGVSLTRRADGKEAYGMTFNLLLNSEGNKMGKTEKGAVWLDPQKTPPYEFYQYWRNVDDADVIKCLKMLTFIPVSQIIKYEKLEGSELNPIKEMLAYEVTKLIHGEDEAEKARNAAKALFSSGADSSDMPTTALSDDDFEDGGALITAVMVKAGIAKSRGDARRLIEQGGVMIDDEKLADFAYRIPRERLESGHIIIKKGKKVFHKIKI